MGRREDAIREIKMNLGYPIVTVELSDDDIGWLVDNAMQFLNSYSTDRAMMTVDVVDGVVDLTPYSDQIYNVLNVLPTKATTNSEVDTVFDDVDNLVALSRSRYAADYSTNLLVERARQKSVLAMETPISFRLLNKNTLLLSEKVSRVTLEYRPIWKDQDELDEYWDNLVGGYALAECKIVIGRARKKYTSQKALHEVDSSLLDEGREEMDAINESLSKLNTFFCEVV